MDIDASNLFASNVTSTLATLYDSSLPHLSGDIGEYIAIQVARYTPTISPILVDLMSFLHQLSSAQPQKLKFTLLEDNVHHDHQAFHHSMSQHAGYSFVVPGPVGSHARHIKAIFLTLPPHVYANKHTALVTYTREDTVLVSKRGQSIFRACPTPFRIYDGCLPFLLGRVWSCFELELYLSSSATPFKSS